MWAYQNNLSGFLESVANGVGRNRFKYLEALAESFGKFMGIDKAELLVKFKEATKNPRKWKHEELL
jgi:hypothetical protein